MYTSLKVKKGMSRAAAYRKEQTQEGCRWPKSKRYVGKVLKSQIVKCFKRQKYTDCMGCNMYQNCVKMTFKTTIELYS